ncbi:MAG TPA: hypothetical protein VF407_23090 [Polyangiaceae bacterium]
MRTDPTFTVNGEWNDLHDLTRVTTQRDDFEFRSMIVDPDAGDDEWAAPSERSPRFPR